MATRTKHSYTVTVYTIGGGEFTAADVEGVLAGTAAWQSFLHGGVIEIPGDEGTAYVPYHAIDHVVVVVEADDEEYTDDTCVQADAETPEEPSEP